MTVPAGRPTGRYGADPARRRPGLVAAGVALVAALGGWALWATLGATAPPATGQVIGFTVRGPAAIEVRLVVGGDRGPVACTIRALDRTRDVVGVTTARATVGSTGRGEATVLVRTRATAVTAVVDGCSPRQN